jgi:chemotaxis protein methyltransferase CheR
MIRFQVDNLLEPRNVTGTFDLILCRNVLFYFPPDKRSDVCDRIARHARQGSYLVLGAGEMLSGGSGPFSSCRALSCAYVAEFPICGIGCLPAERQSALPPRSPIG